MHSDPLINQKTIKVKKSMFRKHPGSELNQRIRVIQKLVPGRQHFIHNPIYPSRSIFPLEPSFYRMIWDIRKPQLAFLAGARSGLCSGQG